MKKAVVILLALCVLGAYIANRYSQRILVWMVNPRINVAGLRLMMPESEVTGLIGKEEERRPGFGGYAIRSRATGFTDVAGSVLEPSEYSDVGTPEGSLS